MEKDPEKATQSRAERYKNNPEKAKQRSTKWRKNNPEKVKQSNAKWRKNNPEKAKQSNAKWRKNNPEKVKQSNAKWHKNNPEKAKQRRAERYKNKKAKNRRTEEHLLPFKKRKYVEETIQSNIISSAIISTSPEVSDISYSSSFLTNHEPVTESSASPFIADSFSSNMARPSVICWASKLLTESNNSSYNEQSNNNLLQPDSLHESWSHIETNIVDNSDSETNKETHLNFSKQGFNL